MVKKQHQLISHCSLAKKKKRKCVDIVKICSLQLAQVDKKKQYAIANTLYSKMAANKLFFRLHVSDPSTR